MRLISKIRTDSVSQVISTGAIVAPVSEWTVTILNDEGIVLRFAFDHDPTDQEIFQVVRPGGTPLVPTTKASLEDAMIDAYNDWSRWKATRIEAQARTLAAPIITALQNKEDAAWTTYLNLLNAWRTAT